MTTFHAGNTLFLKIKSLTVLLGITGINKKINENVILKVKTINRSLLRKLWMFFKYQPNKIFGNTYYPLSELPEEVDTSFILHNRLR